MKLFYVFFIFLVGCDANYTDVKQHYKLPPEMSSCSLYELKGDSSVRTLFVVRCDNQTTTNNIHSCGKGCTKRTDVTVDNIQGDQ
jgi:hypothetical protein